MYFDEEHDRHDADAVTWCCSQDLKRRILSACSYGTGFSTPVLASGVYVFFTFPARWHLRRVAQNGYIHFGRSTWCLSRQDMWVGVGLVGVWKCVMKKAIFVSLYRTMTDTVECDHVYRVIYDADFAGDVHFELWSRLHTLSVLGSAEKSTFPLKVNTHIMFPLCLGVRVYFFWSEISWGFQRSKPFVDSCSGYKVMVEKPTFCQVTPQHLWNLSGDIPNMSPSSPMSHTTLSYFSTLVHIFTCIHGCLLSAHNLPLWRRGKCFPIVVHSMKGSQHVQFAFGCIGRMCL